MRKNEEKPEKRLRIEGLLYYEMKCVATEGRCVSTGATVKQRSIEVTVKIMQNEKVRNSLAIERKINCVLAK